MGAVKCSANLNRIIILFLSIVFVFFMATLFGFYLVKGDSSRWQVALGGIGVSAFPLLFLFLKNNLFKTPMIIGYYFFIFCTSYLGSIASFYLKYKWWDSTLHFYKGIFVGFVGIVLYKGFIPPQSRRNLSKWMIFLFTLSLAVTASVLWEIYEFIGDLYFTNTMQRGGNVDTMYDLLSGSAGGLLVSLYLILRKESY